MLGIEIGREDLVVRFAVVYEYVFIDYEPVNLWKLTSED